jgi:4-alpha-glucanotransferase
MELESEFRNLSMKFLFVCDNSSELNHLLDDLNSLEYKHQQISDSTLIVQSIESLAKISTSTNVNTIIKACHLIKQLMTKQKINLPEVVSNKIINWILQLHQKSKEVFTCEALDVLSLLFKKNSKAVSSVSMRIVC